MVMCKISMTSSVNFRYQETEASEGCHLGREGVFLVLQRLYQPPGIIYAQNVLKENAKI